MSGLFQLAKTLKHFGFFLKFNGNNLKIWKSIKALGNMKQSFLPLMLDQLECKRCLETWKEPFTFTDKPCN